MAHNLSEPFEALLARNGGSPSLPIRARVVIVGSGYGGSVAAFRLSGLGTFDPPFTDDVMVLERGNEFSLGQFPTSVADLGGHFRVQRCDGPPAGNEDALFSLHTGKGVDVLVGSGLGGTSLINANVALKPEQAVFESPSWPQAIRRDAADPDSPLWKSFLRVKECLDVEDVGRYGDIVASRKHQAILRYAKALGFRSKPAEIAVWLGDAGENWAGVNQARCTRCGNCVSGCNVGAKNTLMMNLIPAAKQRGARFYTGASVLNVRRVDADNDMPWRVRVRATSRGTRAKVDGAIEIHARYVILSAGALGSTEILKRSEKLGLQVGGGKCPPLGSRFSTNGDGLAASFAQRDEVNAIGAEDFTKDSKCGPTITSVVSGNTRKVGGKDRFTLQEGSVPSALKEVFGEIVTTAAQFGRIGNSELPGWHKSNRRIDPLAVRDEALKRSQIFLVMSEDESRGSLKLETPTNDLDEAHIVPVWTPENPGHASPVLERIEKVLRKEDRSKGLDKGQYVPNPLWRLLPEAAEDVMDGLFPGQRLITVHPLGGCVMGENGASGVVNHLGQVFTGAGEDVYDGLLVLDGSILPRAVGVNPFLTISALAWRACETLRQNLGNERAVTAPVSQPAALVPKYLGSRGEPASVVVRERLLGKLAPISERHRRTLERYFASSSRWFEYDGLILHVETLPGQSELLASGEEIRLKVKARLYENLVPAHRAERARTYGVPSEHVNPKQLIAESDDESEDDATISILTRDMPGVYELFRAVRAFRAYLQRRQTFWSIWKGTSDLTLGKILKGIAVMYDVAAMHATYRDFVYDIKLKPKAQNAAGNQGKQTSAIEIHIQGRKRIAWRPEHPRLWQALIELPAKVRIGQRGKWGIESSIQLEVDTGYLVGDGLLRVLPEADRDFVKGLVQAGGFAAYFMRSILQAGFWEFGSPEYREGSLPTKPALPARLKKGTACDPTIQICVPIRVGSAKRIPLRLHRFPSAQKRQGVALLIHGLAQGSLIYAHPAMPESLTEHLHAAGFDVWLLDYRLSNVFTEAQVKFDGWSIDEIGQIDMPAAIETVVDWYRKEQSATVKLHVFAHCVGAIGMSIAILDGKVSSTWVQSLVLNAIHPWTLPSPANQLRARALGLFRDLADDVLFNPIIQSKKELKPESALLDRLAFSLARLGETPASAHPLNESDEDYAQAICDRMTLLYGRMWRHENTKAVHPFWKDMMGRAPASVQRHLYRMATHKRVLDHEGRNIWLLEENLTTHWVGIRTLFMHGETSDVFNPQSATRSAARFVRMLTDNGRNPLKDVIGLKRIRDYGHMDVILADEAPDRSFPYIREFFRGSFDHGTSTQLPDGRWLRLDPIDLSDDAHVHAQLRPECGPIIRGARMDGDLLLVRIWIELPWINTSSVDDVKVQNARNTDPRYSIDEIALGDRFRWFDVHLDPYRVQDILITGITDGTGTNFVGPPTRTAKPHRAAAPSPLDLFSIGRLLRRTPGWNPAELAWVNTLTERILKPDPVTCDFLVGSCLYPGTPFDREAAEGIFVNMAHQICTERGGDALFLIGDLIYADATAGLLDPVTWHDRYQDRYRDALKMPALREVLNSIPTHFAVDDHEFADNFAGPSESPSVPTGPYRAWHEQWIAHRMKRGLLQSGAGKAEFEFAANMARSYLHSGRIASHRFGRSAARPKRLWYALDHDAEFNCPTFILDTRSKRQRATATSKARLLGVAQMSALKKWLRCAANVRRPKFVFSGSAIVPLPRDEHAEGGWLREDGWAGYPEELSELLRFIADNDIKGVVFVGGDLHFSAVAELNIKVGPKNIGAWQIVASGLYAPLPFANPDTREFDWNTRSRLPLSGCELEYKPTLLTKSAAHFVHVRTDADVNSADHWKMVVTAHLVSTVRPTNPAATRTIGPLSINV